jgi:hypothetical protein
MRNLAKNISLVGYRKFILNDLVSIHSKTSLE